MVLIDFNLFSLIKSVYMLIADQVVLRLLG